MKHLSLILILASMSSYSQYDEGNLDVGVNLYAGIALEPVVTYKYTAYTWSYGGSYGLTMQPSDISHTAMVLIGPTVLNSDFIMEVEGGIGVNYGVEDYFTNLKEHTLIKGKIIKPTWSVGVRSRFNNRFIFSFKICSPGFIKAGFHFNLL